MRPSQHVLQHTIFACLTVFSLCRDVAAQGKPGASGLEQTLPPGQHWVSSWGTAQQVVEPGNQLPAKDWRDASLRQIVHVSLGGTVLRVRLSNAFGTAPLVIDGASVALARAPGLAAIDPQTVRALTFDGRAAIAIPPGAEYVSDSVALLHRDGADLAISLHFNDEPARQSGHPGSRANSFYVAGNRVADTEWPEAGKVAHWYAIADVEVAAPLKTGAVVAIGDSITDGHGATTDGNDRWPDFLARRLAGRAGKSLKGGVTGKGGMGGMGVINAGIGGGRMLLDGLGPNLASRFERDVIARAGVTHAIVMIGVNDLGSQHRNKDDTPARRAAMLADLRLAHRQLVERAHAHGICVIGATITPYTGSDYYHPEADNEADRNALNDWIRHGGVFDGVADFDAALRDPADARKLRPAFDSGDGLHPSPAGFSAMADAVPLAALGACRAAR